MAMLTQRQKEMYDFIRAYYAKHGIAPSFMEMMDATGRSSKSGVHRVLVALEERGFIRRMRDRARAIELVPDPHLLLTLSQIGDTELALECHRRGYVMGRWQKARERLGDGYMEVMHFREVAPRAR
jgi:SOS-response transcriptional repressor LexA